MHRGQGPHLHSQRLRYGLETLFQRRRLHGFSIIKLDRKTGATRSAKRRVRGLQVNVQ